MRQIQSTYIARVACGVEHCLLLTSSGFVYSFGKNSRGQLGHAPNEQQSQPSSEDDLTPRMIFALLNMRIDDMAAGDYHSIATGRPRSNTAALAIETQAPLAGGQTLVYAWGDNRNE